MFSVQICVQCARVRAERNIFQHLHLNKKMSYSLQSQWGARAAHHNTIGYTPIHPQGYVSVNLGYRDIIRQKYKTKY